MLIPTTDIAPNPLINTITEIRIQEEEPDKKKTQTYKIKKNDTLEKIAEKYDTTWLRLFYKNKNIKHPDQLEVGTKINIPESNEKLTERDYYIEPINYAPNTKTAARTAVSGSSGWYDSLQCTGYVASRRVVGQWGDAVTWPSYAKAEGYYVGSVPVAGAIGQRGNHVVYVEKVDGDRVYISERNYDWNGSYREMWRPISYYTYIY